MFRYELVWSSIPHVSLPPLLYILREILTLQGATLSFIKYHNMLKRRYNAIQQNHKFFDCWSLFELFVDCKQIINTTLSRVKNLYVE